MSSVPHSHLQWLKKKVSGQEHVTFENFVTLFELTDQLSATHAYQQLISFPECRKTRRTYLQDSFDFFRKNREKQFWARRAVAVSNEVVGNRALVTVQEFGQVQSQIVLETASRDSLVSYELDRGAGGRFPRAVLNKDHLPDLSIVEDVSLGSSTQMPPSRSTGKRTAAQPLQNSNKRLGVTIARDEYVDTHDPSNQEDHNGSATLPSTPENRPPSPAIIRTESLESIPDVYTLSEKDPFHVHEDDDEDEGSTSTDADNDILLPDSTDQDIQFSGVLNGIDMAIGVPVPALARSGIILLDKEGTDIQKLYFGRETLAQMREKALEKWQNSDVTSSRNKVRAWLDTLEDHEYDREKSQKHMFNNAPLDGEQGRLWTFLLTAIQEFPLSDSTKCYSESTSISSFILPLCRVFMGIPDQRVFLNFVDSTTTSGRGCKSRKEPDLALEIKDGYNKTVCEVGVGEVTSHAQKGLKLKNAKDLVRIGLSLKDALDIIEDTYGVRDAVLPGWQVIGQSMSVYLMFKCGNLYVMVHARDATIPDNLSELGTIGAQIKIWSDLKSTIERGLSPVCKAVSSGKGRVISIVRSAHTRIETTRTPEFKTFLRKV